MCSAMWTRISPLDITATACIVEKKKLAKPRKLVNVIRCKNPRCITSAEEEIDHIFYLSENGRYRCAYCEQEPNKSNS